MALVNWVYGANWTDRKLDTDFYLIKDGVIQSGYSAVKHGSATYSTVSNSLVVHSPLTQYGIHINFDITNKTKLKFIAKAQTNDVYNLFAFWNQYDKFQSYSYDKGQAYIPATYTTYELNISAYSGASCIDLIANAAYIYCTDMWLE